MDLPNIETYLYPDDIQAITNWGEGWTWLAGGTWLFSEPQPQLKVLVDIQPWRWSEIEIQGDNLIIGATCPLIKLLEYPWLVEWTAVAGLKSAINELSASFKTVVFAMMLCAPLADRSAVAVKV